MIEVILAMINNNNKLERLEFYHFQINLNKVILLELALDVLMDLPSFEIFYIKKKYNYYLIGYN